MGRLFTIILLYKEGSSMPKIYTLAVIGGGASGLLGAVRAAELLGGANVILLEAAPRVGKNCLQQETDAVI